MRRVAVLLILLAAASSARASEGVYLTLDGGYALWNGKSTMKSRLATQVGDGAGACGTTGAGNATLLVDCQLKDSGLFGLHLGYNIGGHVGIEGGIAVVPWSLFANDRGGVGLMGLAVRWFPLQGLVKPTRMFDFSLLGGMDYFLMGANGTIPAGQSDPLPNSGRGLDGMAFEFGATFELYPARWISLGLTPRLYALHALRYFTDYNNRDKGGQIPLDGNIGGNLLSLALSVTFHFEPLPE